jgi:N-acetylneuraminate synthase
MNVYKIGSGDITWSEMLAKVASKGKPVILATGAASIGDVQRAVEVIQGINPQICLMQCNTNYTGSLENFKYIHLNVLKTFQVMFPQVVLGLSDHTHGHATVLGAVALGARVIEKHFTDDNQREGPDHPFSMTPTTWRDMVERTHELEQALGDTNKRIVENEQATAVVQRRCIRVGLSLKAGTILTRDMLEVLRPAPHGSIFPYEIDHVISLRLKVDVISGQHLQWAMLE